MITPTRRDALGSLSIVLPSLGAYSKVFDALNDDSRQANSDRYSVEQLLGVIRVHEWPAASTVHSRTLDMEPPDDGWAYTLTQFAELQRSLEYEPLSNDGLVVDGHFGLCVAERDGSGAIQSTFNEAYERLRRYRDRYPHHETELRKNSIGEYMGVVLQARQSPVNSDTRYSQASLVQQFPWGLLMWDVLWDPQVTVAEPEFATQHHQWLQTKFPQLRRRPTLGIRERWQQLHTSSATAKILTTGLSAEVVDAVMDEVSSTLVERRNNRVRDTGADSSVTWSPAGVRDA